MSRLRVLPVLAISTAIVAAACAPTPAPGIVLVAVSSNLVPGQDWQQGFLAVGDLSPGSTGTSNTQFYPRDTNLPFTLSFHGIEPDKDAKYTARARIVLAKADPLKAGTKSIDDGAGTVVAVRDIQFDLPGPQEQQMVRISIDWLSMSESDPKPIASYKDAPNFDPFPSTFDALCSTTLDAAGDCVPLQADTEAPFDRKIETYDPKLVFGGGESPDDGSSCYPATDCFAGTTAVTGALVNGACQVDIGGPLGDTTSVAVLTASTDAAEIARCGTLGCGDDLGAGHGVVLDRELLTASGNVVTLPKKVCARFPAGPKVLVSNRCTKKERALPLCPNNGAPGRVNTPRRVTPT